VARCRNYDSLLEAAEFVRVLQRRQGQLIAAPEEIAFHNGWISGDQLTEQAERFRKTHTACGCWTICAVKQARSGLPETRIGNLRDRYRAAISRAFGV